MKLHTGHNILYVSISWFIMYVNKIIHYNNNNNNKAHLPILLVFVVAVCMGQNAGRLQA